MWGWTQTETSCRRMENATASGCVSSNSCLGLCMAVCSCWLGLGELMVFTCSREFLSGIWTTIEPQYECCAVRGQHGWKVSIVRGCWSKPLFIEWAMGFDDGCQWCRHGIDQDLECKDAPGLYFQWLVLLKNGIWMCFIQLSRLTCFYLILFSQQSPL